MKRIILFSVIIIGEIQSNIFSSKYFSSMQLKLFPKNRFLLKLTSHLINVIELTLIDSTFKNIKIILK
jgi:hypothetical protein